ncbi:S-layer homology domain-containing protein [Paenibacillus thalictri]|uniref:S-layer homology domain-containing protein n=1 Tax=Paenibacillus thalictri TaxID=2527873 RepID=A0A4Q9DRT2_9BACL|nr:S-layer homology domain-containing protein [Paenibacillus thalictri]TBL79514.1 S-layer homology domain-containing protein [Paenibacillus thalictri]
MKSKRLTSLLLCAMLLQSPSFTAFAAGPNVLQNQATNGAVIQQNVTFVDLKNDYWAYEAISDLSRKGYINGYEDETFKPENQITREEFAKLISTTFYLDIPSPSAPSYYDVDPGRWSYGYVEAAKTFLTGYYPPGGKAFFSPDIKATREDVAVALVKILGLSASDLNDKNILRRKFKDTDLISYGIRDYVAIATEKALISGYEDGTFRPDKPITRAEIATLLYRSIKASSQDQSEVPILKVSVPAKTGSGTFYVQGTVTAGAKVYINDQPVTVTDGFFKEGFKVDEEGSYEIQIVAKAANGKTVTVYKTIVYEIEPPQITVDDIPESTSSQSFYVSWSVSDANDNSPAVYLNNQKFDTYWGGYSGSYHTNVQLQEGENALVFKAKNRSGKTAIVTKTITLISDGPILKVDDIPDSTSSHSISVTGTVSDQNDYKPVVYLNDVKLDSFWGSFSKYIDLQEGENTLVFKARNSSGKTTVVTKTIFLTTDGPILKVDDIPDSTSSQSISVTGTVSDKNDSRPIVYLNDAKLDSFWGSFSKTVQLEEGENTLVFKARNSSGKTTVVTKTITFNVGGPVLKVYDIPETTSRSSITISGTVSDKNDSRPVVYLNDEQIDSSWGSFSKYVPLKLGENSLVIKAVNNLGKSSTVTKSVYYQK